MFYIKDNEGKIVLFDENRGVLENTLEFTPQYKDFAILETKENEVIVDFQLMTLDEAEQAKIEAEKERVSHLTCTKRVLALALQEYGLTYTKLKELIATNEQAQLEWDLCERLERNNPLLDIMGAEIGVTPEQLDNIFKLANGEQINDNSTDATNPANTVQNEIPKEGV